MKHAVIFFLLCIVFASPVLAREKMEIFPLKHRQASEMIPVIQSLLGGEGTVTGMRNQLVVRTTPENLKQVRAVIEKLDTKMVNLVITVKQDASLNVQQQEAEISGSVKVGEKGRVVVAPGTGNSGGLTASGSFPDGEVKARVNERTFNEDEGGMQQVTTLEGRPAVIHITQSIPFVERETVRDRGKVFRNESLVFRDVTTGFTVLPRLQGDQVVIEINPVASRTRQDVIESHAISTTVSGRLGEWIELGGLSQQSDSGDSGILSRSTENRSEQRKVFLKVEKKDLK